MTDKTKKLQSLLDAQVGKGGLSNIVAAVQSYDHNLDFTGAAGIADPDTGAAMTPDTPYFITSVTKMYTAAIIMRMYEEKQLDLEAPDIPARPGRSPSPAIAVALPHRDPQRDYPGQTIFLHDEPGSRR